MGKKGDKDFFEKVYEIVRQIPEGDRKSVV